MSTIQTRPFVSFEIDHTALCHDCRMPYALASEHLLALTGDGHARLVLVAHSRWLCAWRVCQGGKR